MKTNYLRSPLLLGYVLLRFASLVIAAAEEAPTSPEVNLAAPQVIKSNIQAEPSQVSVAQVGTSKETLTVDFPDEDVRNIVRNVADLYELNILIPDGLQGRVSIKLKDVTWRQVYKAVLAPVGYDFIEDEGVVKIVSQEQLQNEPFVTKKVLLDNVSAANIQPLLSPLLTPKKDKTETSPEARGGTIIVNTFGNELIITDRPKVVAELERLVKNLDVEPRQVVMETKFVEVTKRFNRELGTSFAYFTNSLGGDREAVLNSFGQRVPRLSAEGASYPTGDGAPTFSAVLASRDFAVALRAIQSDNDSRIISNPTVVAVNGTPSEIKTVRIEPTLNESVGNGDNSQVAIKAEYDEKIYEGVKLKVTPRISTNNLVSLSIEAEKQDLPTGRIRARSNVLSDLVTRNVKLEMILRNGYTAAIGGLIDKSDSSSDARVPILGSVPVLGYLFRSKTKGANERNLIIFITASILEPSKTTYQNLTPLSRLHDLNITDRDIQGASYQVTDEERAAYERAAAARKEQQDRQFLEAVTPKPSKK